MLQFMGSKELNTTEQLNRTDTVYIVVYLLNDDSGQYKTM